MSPAQGIKAILESLTGTALVTTGGWELRIGKQPSSPDKVITILDSGGRGAEPNLTIDYPNVQILVRGDKTATGYPDAYSKMEKVRAVLLGIPSGHAEYPALTSCTQRGGIVSLGLDENDRPRFSLNFQLITEPEADTDGHRV
jgi:hypothetical protein